MPVLMVGARCWRPRHGRVEWTTAEAEAGQRWRAMRNGRLGRRLCVWWSGLGGSSVNFVVSKPAIYYQMLLM